MSNQTEITRRDRIKELQAENAKLRDLKDHWDKENINARSELGLVKAQCAEMKSVIHKMYHWEDDERSASIDKEAQHAMSLDCGKGWHSPEDWDELNAEYGREREEHAVTRVKLESANCSWVACQELCERLQAELERIKEGK